jgi:hypothetical protein
MGVVADCTGTLFDRIFAMRRSEGGLVALVAGSAKCGWRHGEEIPFRRSMGKVACRAALLLQNLVPDLPVVVFLLVTLEADGIAFGTQEIG